MQKSSNRGRWVNKVGLFNEDFQSHLLWFDALKRRINRRRTTCLLFGLFGPSTQNSGNFDLQLSLQCVLLGTEMLMIKPPHPQPGPSFSPTERANRLNWGRQSTRRGSVWVCWASDNKGPRLRFKDNKDVYHLRISNLVDPARPH